MKKLFILTCLVLAILSSCSKKTKGSTVVKPKYHHSWYKDHVYKRKWQVGRVRLRFEKQGVKKVKMKG